MTPLAFAVSIVGIIYAIYYVAYKFPRRWVFARVATQAEFNAGQNQSFGKHRNATTNSIRIRSY